jgi:uncharacterized protein (DUF305 family)
MNKIVLLKLAVTVASVMPLAHAEQPVPNMAAAMFETMFLKSMPDHHNVAVEMSRICLTKGVRTELSTVCQQVIDAQQREITMMQNWARTWYEMQVAPQLHKEDREMLESLRAMTTADFEKEYMKMMIRHHWLAISMAGGCVERAHDLHRDMEAMCEDIIETQVDEIRKLRDWLCRRYGNCNFRSDGDLHPKP